MFLQQVPELSHTSNVDKPDKYNLEKIKQDSKESTQYYSIHEVQKQIKLSVLFRDTLSGSKTIKKKT